MIVRVRRGKVAQMRIPRLPRISGGYDELNAVVAPAANAAWAVGGGLILRWDGHRWRSAHAPIATYEAVDETSRRDVWAVGVQGIDAHFIVVHWDGVMWRRIPAPSVPPPLSGGGIELTSHLEAVLALGPDNVWVAGGPGPFVAHWNGTEWTSYPMPSRYDGEIVWSLVNRGPQEFLAAGDQGMYEWTNGTWVATKYQVYRGSPSWQITTDRSQLWGLASPAAGDRVVRLQGSAWAPVGKPLKDGGFNDLTADSHGHIWAVGAYDDKPRPSLFEYRCH